MLDSLVRVSRRVERNHFVTIAPVERLESCLAAYWHLTSLDSALGQTSYNRISEPIPTFLSAFSSIWKTPINQVMVTRIKRQSKSSIWNNNHAGLRLTRQLNRPDFYRILLIFDSLVSVASLLTISSTVSLSFQSSFHLSLTVLVRYRSLANI